MDKQKVKRYAILSVLFFLPVAFLLLLLPAKHHYTPLEVVKHGVKDLQSFTGNPENVLLADHISIVGFLGNDPMEQAVMASNVKELVYDKFKGFKKFQIIMIVPNGRQAVVEKLRAEISGYEELKYWHFVYGSPSAIAGFYRELKTEFPLNGNQANDEIFIIDKDLNQRGRLNDENGLELTSYNTIKVSELKNKFGDDLRVLFQEYREKRKGTFESSDERRANDLKSHHEQD